MKGSLHCDCFPTRSVSVATTHLLEGDVQLKFESLAAEIAH